MTTKFVSDLIQRSAIDNARRAQEDKTRLAIAEQLPDGFEYGIISTYPLYGSIGSVTIKTEWAHLDNVLATFDPIPLMLVKDGSTSFHPLDTLPDTPRGELTHVKPYTFAISTHEVKAEWYTRLGDGSIIGIDAVLTDGDKVFHVYTRYWRKYLQECYLDYKNATGSMGQRLPNLGVYTLRKLGAEVIKWASGSKDYPNSFTVYNFDLSEVTQ